MLVWVKSISDLRSAYPNYYADTREFIAALEFCSNEQRAAYMKRIMSVYTRSVIPASIAGVTHSMMKA